MTEFQAAVLNALPASFTIGKANVLRLTGCWNALEKPLRQLEVLVNNKPHPVPTWLPATPAATGRYDFWALIPVTEQTERLELAVHAVQTDGQTRQQSVGQLQIDTIKAKASQTSRQGGQPLVAICMAVFNPDLALFQQQIASIRAQTWPHWRCIIRDDGSGEPALQAIREMLGQDERFTLVAAPERSGFYHNFERCLALAPPEADFIALADQDDNWRPHKLQRAIEQFTAETWLVYSDMHVVNTQGEIISPTFWQYRRNNYTDLGALLLINTVPGAGTVFRRELLEYILPFPPRARSFFHDHWIAVMALTLGKLKFVDEPLYDWVQHHSNAGGFAETPPPTWRSSWERVWQTLSTVSGQLAGRGYFEDLILPLVTFARVAALRAQTSLSPDRRQVLERMGKLDHSLRSLVWLVAQGLFVWEPRKLTNRIEYYYLCGALWRHVAVWKAHWHALLARLPANP